MGPRPLGGQQLRRLRELREAGDNEVHAQHLKRSGGVSSALYDVRQSVALLTSRTVDAIVQERLQHKGNVSASARLRGRVAAARRGVQTERSERPGDELRPVERTKTTIKIAAVRRRGAMSSEEDTSGGRRRMGRQEAEWSEKQLQYRARVATMEKECRAAWQSFFAGAGVSTASAGFVSPAEVNKLIEEMETLREEGVHKVKHQLRKLSSKASDVQAKVKEIENGDQFLSELQERIDAMEAALAKFRLNHRQQFEEYALEEKVLEKELASFMEKLQGWENETTPQLSRGGASTASLGPRLTHLNSRDALNSQYDSVSKIQSGSDIGGECGDCSSGNQEEDRTARIGTPDELGMVNRVRLLNDAILRSGGLKGGWDSREHAAFTTLLVKCGLTDDVLLQCLLPETSERQSLRVNASNQDSNNGETSQTNSRSDFETRVARFLRKCMRKIVTQTESSVRSHFEWHLRHLELVEEKKRVIQEWKMRKEEERRQIIQCGFEAYGNSLESLDHDRIPETSRDNSSRKLTDRAKHKSRDKTERLLEQWKLEKKQKDEEHEQRKLELQRKRDAVEAKRKQEQLDAKQKVLLYKLQKEQEAMMLEHAPKLRQDVADEGLPTGSLPFSSPTSKEDLDERSRIAIEYAKAKRLRLQQIEERKKKGQQLPPRPENKTADDSVNTSPQPVLALNATEASKARDLSKEEIRRKARRRERQSAHDAYIPGKRAIPDVKFKSFGHVPIQPRAVPAWRKNI
ncbi:hypothetical protein PHYPSEUDO_002984 [Phytophthora pseudosyringae]|uniref:Uncharacterized protein n=1 Tax=Phytophthora pseudosyringae TaxID=221518 RepID=A0A8T1VVL6_9STRA|nr:hypothetical protein PHYPSEUDO_002984 [Phytophthora pseudosyringae]